MEKYRKKPVVIEAIKWNGSFDVVDKLRKQGVQCGASGGGKGELLIDTLEGEMRARIGDWIIKGVHGEFYPCKPDIFEKTYEPVEPFRSEK